MKIKELREEKQISQKALAEAVDTSQRNIGRWENGENEPSYAQLVRLANFFGVSLDYLVGREDDFGNVVVSGQTSDQLSAKEKRLLKAFSSLSEIEKEKLIDDAEFYALRHVKQEQH